MVTWPGSLCCLDTDEEKFCSGGVRKKKEETLQRCGCPLLSVGNSGSGEKEAVVKARRRELKRGGQIPRREQRLQK